MTNEKGLALVLDMDKGFMLSNAELIELRKIRELDLSGKKLMSLPESIGQLTNLSRLDLSNTPISSLPESIGQLTNLTELVLNNTPISSLPESISQLTNLSRLDLSNTPISSLPESIGQLTNLSRLDLSNTPISSLPENISQLTNLSRLDLNNTQISSLPESIGQLTNLRSLFLLATPIRSLPESIGHLINLKYVYLGYTLIRSLPESIGQLINLKYLWLNDTGIRSLPESIGQLTNLKILDLCSLNLDCIPKSLALKGLEFKDSEWSRKDDSAIYINNLKLRNQDVSIFLQSPELIAAYYNDTKKESFREAKVIFLGDGEAGKTYTIKRFLNEGKKEDYSTQETPGVEIERYHVEGENSFDINFWDFGGQEILHSMHRCFLTGRTCYVVVVKSRHKAPTNSARYWLKNIESFAPGSPVILLLNCWGDDDGKSALDESLLYKEFLNLRDIIKCSVKYSDESKFKELMQKIIDFAESSDSCKDEFPESWNKIRLELLSMKDKNENYIDRKAYIKLCKDNGVENQNEITGLLGWFNDLGVCFSYHQGEDKIELSQYKLLNPEWLTNALYAIIKEGTISSDRGVINKTAVENLLENPAPKSIDDKPYRRTRPDITYNKKKGECDYVIEIAEKFNLCYKQSRTRLFFPALCDNNTPEGKKKEILNKTGNRMTYQLRYTYLPDSVIHQLMVACYRQKLVPEECWLRGLIIKGYDNISAVVSMNEEDTKLNIDIYSAGTIQPNTLFKTLRTEIMNINNRLNLNAKEYIVASDVDCFSIKTLENALNRGREYIDGEDENKEYNVKELLGMFFDKDDFPFEKREERYREMREMQENDRQVNIIIGGNSTIVGGDMTDSEVDQKVSKEDDKKKDPKKEKLENAKTISEIFKNYEKWIIGAIVIIGLIVAYFALPKDIFKKIIEWISSLLK